MSILTDGLPRAIEIDGKAYAVRWDHQTCLRIVMAFEDPTLTAYEKTAVLLLSLYVELPENKALALEKGLRFLDCGATQSADAEAPNRGRLYSFAQDERYIFSGVDRALGGRLSRGEDVHWWSFVSAFIELPDDCVMSRILYYRARYAKGKLTKEELKVYNENKALFELKTEETTEEKEQAAAFFAALNGKTKKTTSDEGI